MRKPLAEQELQELDKELIAAGVPLKDRGLEVFKRTYGSVPDGNERSELFHAISTWYLSRYEDAAAWDGIIGRFPLLIRGGIYLSKSVFVMGEVIEDFKLSIEGLPQELGNHLTELEVRA